MSRRWLRSLIALLAVAAGSYAWFATSRSPQLPAGIVYGNGHIEATEVRLSAEAAGRVLEHELAEGARVAAGQVVAILDPSTSREELRVIQGELAALLLSDSALESQIQLWEHHIETARRRLERTRSLLASSLASPREEEAAEDALKEAETQLASLTAERQVLQSRIDSARARVRLAKDRLEKTEVEAPLDGTVLIRAVEAGELVQMGQTLALIAKLDKLQLEIYLPGDVLGKVALGDAARVRVDAFADRYFPAQITRIDDFAQFTPRDIHVPAERTRLVYGITLAIDNAQGHLKPGMPADAWVRWDEALAWPDTLAVPRQ